ncbi:MAG TPA: CHAT domain-containing protein [Thermoanaerobaculia bacterium]|nr:CHAT domain-containing protein [Thermoanaerobaculia bacterium]
MHRMIAAAEKARAVEGYITGFPYHPAEVAQEGKAAQPSLHRIRGIASGLAESTPADDASLHTRGVAQLLASDPGGAIASFRRELTLKPRDAQTSNDLAAAYIEQGSKQKSPDRYASALAAADAAITIDPALAAAHFNRALALEHLGIVQASVREYERYAAIEPSSGWAEEARTRIASLRRLVPVDDWSQARTLLERRCASGNDIADLVRRFPQEARTWGEGVYLSDWGEPARTRESSSDALRVARCIGETLRRVSGEELLADAVFAIEHAHPDSQNVLAVAHVTYRKARILYSQRRVDDALPLFIQAEELFRKGASPMRLVAAYYRANAVIDQRDFTTATALLAQMDESPLRYRALQAQIAWARGLILGPLGRPYEALSEVTASREAFERLGERENALYMRANAVHILNVLGRTADAWRARTSIFVDASRSKDPMLLDLALFSAAESEANDERWDVAAALYREDASLSNGAAKLQVEALLGLAVAEWKASGASADLGAARAAAMKLPAEALRQETLDEIRYAEARFALQQNPRFAVGLLDQVIAYRRSRNAIVRLPAVYEELGRAWRSLGDNKRAESSFRTAIDIVKQQCAKLTDPVVRDSFAATASSGYDELIDLYATCGDYRRAFDVAEQSRTVSAPSELVATTADSLSRAIAPGAVVVTISTLPRQAFVTISTRETFRGFVRPVSRAMIATQIDDLRNAVQRDDLARVNAASEKLFNTLVEPATIELAQAHAIIFIADETASRIPLALLRDPVAHLYLVERSSIMAAPSAAFVATRQQPETKRPTRALVVGDPAFSRAEFPALEPLSGAIEEANAVAAFYNVPAIVGAIATWRQIVPQLAATDVIHFAGHVIMNPRDASTTAIPLASGTANDPSVLYLGDIAHMRFERHPVVVLAGCDSASTAPGHGSVKSLANAFLSAGSRTVVGTLWNVEDDASRDLSLAFHRALLTGLSPGASLRTAQLSMLHSQKSNYRQPKSWAGFQLYGNE